jgi:hypothetical protein
MLSVQSLSERMGAVLSVLRDIFWQLTIGHVQHVLLGVNSAPLELSVTSVTLETIKLLKAVLATHAEPAV